MKIKALKKSVSLILTLAMVLSASYAISNFSAYATERKNYIIAAILKTARILLNTLSTQSRKKIRLRL